MGNKKDNTKDNTLDKNTDSTTFEESVKQLKAILLESRPEKWEDIPDIDLYMDQVLNYMTRQHAGLDFGETLTSAMINNYIKKGVLPRANGKRYERSHIAYLTAICLLKQVLSVDSTKDLLDKQLENSDITAFYEKYCSKLDSAYNTVASRLDEGMSKDDVKELALELAISSYAQKLACERLLNSIL